MDVYIDMPNIRSYTKSNGHPNFQDCNKLLKEHCNIFFSFDKDAILREKKDARTRIMNFIRSLTSGRSAENKTEWSVSCSAKPLSEGIYERLSHRELTSVYLIDDPQAAAYANHGCLLISPEGDEVKTLSNLFVDGNRFLKKYPLREMTDWNVIRDNVSPTTDIIIIDPYLFCHPEMEYELNEYAILDALCHNISGRQVNIVLFSTNYDSTTKSYNVIRFSSVIGEIKQRIEKITGIAPNVTFVMLPAKKEHDRSILTNYKMFVSGDSFNYFTNLGQNSSRARHFYVHSHGDKSLHEEFLDYISDLQEIVDRQKSGINAIHGDKKSNFLKFD